MKAKLILLIATLVVTSIPSAYADNYNFYFTKPKKKAKAEAPENKPEETTAASDEEEEAESAQERKDQVVTDKAGGIVIHNHNVMNGATPAATPTTPASSAMVLVTPPSRSKVKMGFSAAYFPKLWRSYDLDSGEMRYGKGWGGAVTLSFTPSTVLAVNLVGSMAEKHTSGSANLFGAAELEINPLAFDPNAYLPLELGLIAGINTELFSSKEEAGLHGGARVTFNLSERFGLSATGRISSGMQMLEAGLITRL